MATADPGETATVYGRGRACGVEEDRIPGGHRSAHDEDRDRHGRNYNAHVIERILKYVAAALGWR
jgi:hypothetical protein